MVHPGQPFNEFRIVGVATDNPKLRDTLVKGYIP